MRQRDEGYGAGSHPDEGTLQAWLDHPRSGLSDDEVRAVEAHLSACETCAARVSALEAESSRVAELLGAVPTPAPPPFADIEARARKHRRPGRVRRWRAGAWAASVALALGTGWMANELFRTDSGARSGFSSEAAPPPAEVPDIERPSPPEGEVVSADPEPAGDAPQATAGSAAPAPAAAPAYAGAERRVEAPADLRAERILRGRVVDAASGQPLEAAEILVPISGNLAYTDTTGAFAVALPADVAAPSDSTVELQVRLPGYGEADRRVALTSDTSIVLADVEMESTALKMAELRAVGVGRGPVIEVVVSGTEWTPSDVDRAADEVGFTLRTVPDLPVSDVALARVDDTVVARVHQPLPGGGVLTLFQSTRALRVVEGPGAAAMVHVSDEVAWVAATAPGSRTVAGQWLEKIR